LAIIHLGLKISCIHLYSSVFTCIRRGRKPNGLFET
jgi:hypothetical protein